MCSFDATWEPGHLEIFLEEVKYRIGKENNHHGEGKLPDSTPGLENRTKVCHVLLIFHGIMIILHQNIKAGGTGYMKVWVDFHLQNGLI